nr:phosphotransferase [Nocardia huaxiensis]
MTAHADRSLTLWPYRRPLDPADDVPWENAAILLARLHRIPLGHLHSGSARIIGTRSGPGDVANSPPTAVPGSSTLPYQPEEPSGGADLCRPHVPGGHRAPIPVSPGDRPARRMINQSRLDEEQFTERGAIPVSGGPARVRRAMDRLHIAGSAVDPVAAAAVWRAHAVLPETSAGPAGDAALEAMRHDPMRPFTLVHGDFHLGQLVRLGDGDRDSLRLIDVDDLGVGDPVWDLARMAGFFAAGILDSVAWERFLNAYRLAGGPAVPAHDEWAVLDGPARALVVQAAAISVAKAGAEGRELDEWDVALVDSCRRMAAAVS